jgi:hypothetical protein
MPRRIAAPIKATITPAPRAAPAVKPAARAARSPKAAALPDHLRKGIFKHPAQPATKAVAPSTPPQAAPAARADVRRSPPAATPAFVTPAGKRVLWRG